MDLLDAAALTVRNYPGGVDAIAARLGKKPGTLRHEVRPPKGATAKLGLLDAIDMVEMSDDWTIINAIMARAGGIALRLPQTGEIDSLTGQRMARVAKEFADLMAEVADCAADGRITPNEFKRINAEWAELVAEGQRLLAFLQQLQPGEGGRAKGKSR